MDLSNEQDNIISLPLMPLREVVLFPKTITPLLVGRESSIKAMDLASTKHNKKIFLITQKNSEVEHITKDDLFDIGTIAKILQILKMPDGTIKVLFEGLERAQLLSFSSTTLGAFEACITPVKELPFNNEEQFATIHLIHEALEEYGKQIKKLAQEPQFARLLTLEEPSQLSDAIMPFLRVSYQKKQELLEINNPIERLKLVYEILSGEIQVASLERNIKIRVKNQMEKNQREYYLNEQIKAIQKEMGKDDALETEIEALENNILSKQLSEEAKERSVKEFAKLKQMPPSSAEYTVVKSYLDCILELPWNTNKRIDIDLKKAEHLLNTNHYGLEKTKERILEFLAVQKLVEKVKGPILCLVGPPGVGKTSLARSIAEATGRDFLRISLGGVRDESEIRGHRRTYVGALPGKILQSLKRVQYNNPLICLDEVDKMSTDFRGDPSAALLEVLDPEQNVTFRDHYLDLDYDLSNIFFITTANSLHTIPLPLRDRMEIIELSGYLEDEKKNIVKSFLLAKEMTAHGIKDSNIKISDNCITDIIRYYTKESGVRNLERQIATICRKVAMQIVSAEAIHKKITVTVQNLHQFLGVRKYRFGDKETISQLGVCTGLAYTELGGELLLVETVIMHGTGAINITGKLGDVMIESAKAAVSYVRSRSDDFGLKEDFHKTIDIHIHVPEGAIPKDGPSAGVTLATSLISALTGIPVRNDIAMTGEISLRGRVLPIGGLREKLFAAKRGSIQTIFIPKENEKDLKEIPHDLLSGLTIHPVEHIDEILPLALEIKSKELFDNMEPTKPLYMTLQKHENPSSCIQQ